MPISIDRILKKIKDAPADLNRERLFQELNSIAAHHRLGDYHRSEPARRRAEIDRIVAAVEKARRLIKRNWLLVYRHDSNLAQLIVDAKKMKSPADQLPDISFGVGENSAFDHLIGEWLKPVFEDHFKMKAGYQRSDGSYEGRPEGVDGPFIDFAEAFLEEAGITNNSKPYSRNTIANAL
jgi:hypothetical protein